MTTVSVTQANNTLLTWANQSLLWSDSLAALRTWEGAYATINYVAAVGELLSFDDLDARKVTKPLSEAFGVSEAIRKSAGLNKSGTLSVSEARVFSTHQRHDEAVIISGGLGNTVQKPFSEAFDIAEGDKRTIGLNPFESVAFLEQHLDSVGFKRNFAEAFAVSESVAKRPHKNVAESFRLLDAWRRAADLVISDMMLSQGDMTPEEFADFMKYGNVPGYTKWRDFIPGDYEYREAMFRVVMESKNSDRGLLTGLQVSVDVPDVLDRGSRMITDANAGAYVAYARTFHIIPEVTLATRGGTSTNPVVPEFVGLPNMTGFTVRLRDTVTGGFVTGSFTWAAHGY